jgi:hypothetical protein
VIPRRLAQLAGFTGLVATNAGGSGAERHGLPAAPKAADGGNESGPLARTL